ncbi:MAG TPA: DinB family protein [Cyclobacteriaceae bacterium]|nr:DinB family protein [Cyclobacteriaceae bacterium]
MKTDIYQALEKLESDTKFILDACSKVDAAKLEQGPKPGKWSVMEIMEHLIAAEAMSLAYMKKKYQGINDIPATGPGASFRLFALKISQRLPLKYKAPKVMLNPERKYHNFESLRQAWQQERQALKAVIDAFDESKINAAIYKHPAAGRFNLKQAVIFFHEHFIHHLPQIKRLIS